ncbi:hypothetical protein IWQ60_007005 [Tieghemiomyces parasiticus]|uniref:Mitochondrial import inner membrane translocase subunit TIM50 n=1 Tax=Tieghemiomyces parasiticus TaxID=78921 RepID=A0A9W8A1A6_9FUNG|nr:hypothetical protein IWQ60_007005 [Tieghemiomyces parasiticus]
MSNRPYYRTPDPVLDMPPWELDVSKRMPLLFVLDLNGTLLCRKKSSSRSRPFVKELLKYLIQYFYVMVWSSAEQQNVQLMVQRLFGEHQRLLVGRWNRAYCDLQRARPVPKRHDCDNPPTKRELDKARRKPLAVKDLSKIWDCHSQYPRTKPGKRGERPPIWMLRHALERVFDPQTRRPIKWHRGNTVIVDDSVDKVRGYSGNHIAVKDFEAHPDPNDNDLQALLAYIRPINALLSDMRPNLVPRFNVTHYFRDHPWAEFRAGFPLIEFIPTEEPRSPPDPTPATSPRPERNTPDKKLQENFDGVPI